MSKIIYIYNPFSDYPKIISAIILQNELFKKNIDNLIIDFDYFSNFNDIQKEVEFIDMINENFKFKNNDLRYLKINFSSFEGLQNEVKFKDWFSKLLSFFKSKKVIFIVSPQAMGTMHEWLLNFTNYILVPFKTISDSCSDLIFNIMEFKKQNHSLSIINFVAFSEFNNNSCTLKYLNAKKVLDDFLVDQQIILNNNNFNQAISDSNNISCFRKIIILLKIDNL